MTACSVLEKKRNVDVTVFLRLAVFAHFLEHVIRKKQFNLKQLLLSFVVLIDPSLAIDV